MGFSSGGKMMVRAYKSANKNWRMGVMNPNLEKT
jgi:hypothetical protein